MKIKVKRTDKRHTAHGRFQYYVEIKHDGWPERRAVHEKFFELRLWCWETWGPSTELSEWLVDASKGITNISHNADWCWVNDQFNKRIYFTNQAAATHFALRWL